MKKYFKDSYEYKRILEILDDYWLTEPDEKSVEVRMHFEHSDGQQQDKFISWENPKRENDKDAGKLKAFDAKTMLEEGHECTEDCKNCEAWAKMVIADRRYRKELYNICNNPLLLSEDKLRLICQEVLKWYEMYIDESVPCAKKNKTEPHKEGRI